MSSYGLESVHAELTAVLADTVRVLEANGIAYSVMCGTLLGAVRHQGFIPWDDDVDLVMPRESYERFAMLYPAQRAADYRLDLTDTWVPRVRKADGDAFVDLFILDPLPEGALARRWKLLRLRMLQGMLKTNTDYTRFSGVKRLLLHATHLLGLPFSREAKLRWYQQIARGGIGKQVHMSNGAFGLLNMAFDREWFLNTETVPFEQLVVRVPHHVDAVLTQLYGSNYMVPPPEAERRPLHLDR